MFTCGFERSNFAFAMMASWVCSVRLGAPYGGGGRRYPPRRLCVFGLDLFRDVLRDRVVMVELHRELRAARRHGPQRVDVAEHVGQRHHGTDRDGVAAGFL